ncbi:GNAT family N-acetyltransferase [Streptomyces sp. NPDC058656]|uniref:GNAT family N-acetyltransferase n=1 Tax=Streptomyces sp. NPDC058656 TaxID=3346578 RepID=UPI00366269B3
MLDMGGDQVEEAVADAVAALRRVADRDWSVKAGRLDWSCRKTAEHIASDCIAYAGQLAGLPTDRYVPFDITFDECESPEDVLQVVEATGTLLAAAVRTAPREARAFHPYPFRSANREGFAAMGVTEVLAHTHDIAEGLGIPYEPPAALCEAVLTRIFPHVRPAPGDGHWRTLLWATGRGDLPGRAPLTEWRWNNNQVIPAERLTLQGVTPAAAADLGAGGTGGFEWIEDGPFEGTRDAAGMVTKAYEAGVHRPEFGLFVLVRREDGRAEVGYDLTESARGNGYAAEALRTLSAWALSRDDVTSLFATVDHVNAPSQSVLSRAGFTRVSGEGGDGEDGEQYAYELRG